MLNGARGTEDADPNVKMVVWVLAILGVVQGMTLGLLLVLALTWF